MKISPAHRFDALLRTLRHVFHVPMAAVSRVDGNHEHFRAVSGLSLHDVRQSESLGTHAVGSAVPLVVPDAALDQRFNRLPLVTEGPRIRFYAACALSVETDREGVIAIFDTVPRHLSDGEIQMLQDLASWGHHEWEGDAAARDLSQKKRIEQMKDDFISTVSHELRTPLTSIHGALSLLSSGVMGSLPEDVKHLIEVSCKNSRRLVRLVNDILDVEKAEAGKLQLLAQPQELMPILEQAVEANRQYASQFRVNVVLKNRMNGARANVDSDRLIQVLTNLISNGSRYSPPGKDVTVSVERHDGFLRVTVANEGPSIPAEFRERIFQKFSQADPSDERGKGGTGLGLSISKSLIERMGGHIGFLDGPNGQGTVFFFDLPEVKS